MCNKIGVPSTLEACKPHKLWVCCAARCHLCCVFDNGCDHETTSEELCTRKLEVIDSQCKAVQRHFQREINPIGLRVAGYFLSLTSTIPLLHLHLSQLPSCASANKIPSIQFGCVHSYSCVEERINCATPLVPSLTSSNRIHNNKFKFSKAIDIVNRRAYAPTLYQAHTNVRYHKRRKNRSPTTKPKQRSKTEKRQRTRHN